jgi:hypothetical protein
MSESGAAGERAPQDPADRDQRQSQAERGDAHSPGDAGDGHGPGDGHGAGAGHGPGGGQGDDEEGRLPADGYRGPDPWAELMRLAEQVKAGRLVGSVVPAWRRAGRGEQRWPVTASVVVAIVLQLQLSDSLTKPLPHSLLPTLEGALGIALIIVNPVRIERGGTLARAGSIVLIMLITAANAISAIVLVRAIILALPDTGSAGPLLASGASVWATNVIAFGLWYWEFDRGGPVHRAEGTNRYPDLMFPQMASPQLAPPDWRPYFLDYLYLSFTNATAFSPTDVMPLSRWAKMTMAVQSAVALAVGALVIARAVNILR